MNEALKAPLEDEDTRAQTSESKSPAEVRRDDSIFGQPKHPRYLSPSESNAVVLDLRHHQAASADLYTIELDRLLVQCCGGQSIHAEPLPMSSFPNLVGAVKAGINTTLFRFHLGSVKLEVRSFIRTAQRIFSWLAQRAIYKLEDVSRADVDKLVDEVSRTGWAETSRQAEVLEALIVRMQSNPSLLAKWANSTSNATRFTLPTERLERMSGLPISEQYLPRSIYQRFANLENSPKPIQRTQILYTPSIKGIAALMHHLNALALSAPASIRFLPFAKVNQSAEKLAKAAELWIKQTRAPGIAIAMNDAVALPPSEKTDVGQTPNLTTKESFAVFSEALAWTYDYAPVIIDVLDHARSCILGSLHLSSAHGGQLILKEVTQYYNARALEHNLPIKEITSVASGECSLANVVQLLLFALRENLGINSARRPNEIVGRYVPYGFYREAMRQVHKSPDIFRVDFYVEKGIQDWVTFPANALMVDAWKVLIQINDLMLPLGETYTAADTLAGRREQKLFLSRRLSAAGLSGPEVQLSDLVSSQYYELAGVNPSRFDGKMNPNRRMFAVLHMHRYDLGEFEALRDHLGHSDISTTAGYCQDRIARSPGESIAEIHTIPIPFDDVLEELRVAAVDYLAELLLRMLNGEEMGSGFPVLAAKLAIRLSADVDFAQLSIERKAQNLAQRLASRRYVPDPLRHAACMGSEAPRHTVKASNCYRDGELHREEASPQKCSGCVNGLTNGGYLKHLTGEIEKAEALAADLRIPEAKRSAEASRAAKLLAVRDAELRTAKRNANIFLRVQEAWETTLKQTFTDNES